MENPHIQKGRGGGGLALGVNPYPLIIPLAGRCRQEGLGVGPVSLREQHRLWLLRALSLFRGSRFISEQSFYIGGKNGSK